MNKIRRLKECSSGINFLNNLRVCSSFRDLTTGKQCERMTKLHRKRSLAIAKASLQASPSRISWSRNPSKVTDEAPTNYPSIYIYLTMTARTPFASFFPVGASTFIFMHPSGGGIHSGSRRELHTGPDVDDIFSETRTRSRKSSGITNLAAKCGHLLLHGMTTPASCDCRLVRQGTFMIVVCYHREDRRTMPIWEIPVKRLK